MHVRGMRQTVLEVNLQQGAIFQRDIFVFGNYCIGGYFVLGGYCPRLIFDWGANGSVDFRQGLLT